MSSDLPAKNRKLRVGAYLGTAKIEILSGEPERYEYALLMLDSLALYYGHHAEALSWKTKIMVDMIDQSASPDEQADYVNKLVAYTDTLRMTCENKDIKKKYRKHCEKFTDEAKASVNKYWRQFYNAGVEQKDEIARIATEIADGVDDDTKEFYDKQLVALSDSSLKNLSMAIVLDPVDARSYIGLGSIYKDQNKLVESIKWLKLGLDRSEDRKPLLTTIAYIYIDQDDYCSAIPYFREYIDIDTTDIATINNLSVCFNNCNMFDSATVMYHRIIEIDSENAGALRGLADYHFTMGRFAGDSARQYRDAKDDKQMEAWLAKRDLDFDSARVYQKQVFELTPDQMEAAERYGMFSYLLGKYEEAAVGYARANEIDPTIADNWSTLGDCYVNLKKFAEAAKAYEHLVEIKPDKLEIWERLSELYIMTDQPKKRSAADKKISALK